MLFNGKNKFSVKIIELKIQDLKNMLSTEKKSKVFNKNSIVDCTSSANERFFESFEIDQFYGYYANPFTKKSIIECLIESKKIKELIYLVN